MVREADEQVDQEAFFKSVPRVQRSGQLAELHLGRCVGPPTVFPISPEVRAMAGSTTGTGWRWSTRLQVTAFLLLA